MRNQEEPTKTVGIILFKKNGDIIEYLLLHHRGPYWNFPKGRMEKGETERETAYREVFEETGIKKSRYKIITDFQTSFLYSFKSQYKQDFGKRVTKKAIFFLAKVQKTKIKISDEHLDFGWFGYEESLKKLHYKNGQKVLQEAHRYLLRR